MSETPERHATAHGFRSSFRDWCSEKGYPRDLAERALAHTITNKVEAAYHRTDLLEQRRPMMIEWEKYCRSLIIKARAEETTSAQEAADPEKLTRVLIRRKRALCIPAKQT